MGQKDEKKDAKRGFPFSYSALYTFSDRVDIQLMLLGLAVSLIQALIPPFVWLFVGDFVSAAMNKEDFYGNHTSVDGMRANEEFRKTSELNFKLTIVLSAIVFVTAFIQRLSWEFTAIRQVFRVKRAYILKLLNMDVSWLESHHSGHVASMIQEHADRIHSGISEHIPMAIFIFSYLLSTMLTCLYVKWDVTLVMCSIIPLLIISRILFSKWFMKSIDDETMLEKKLTNLVSETFSCMRTVISFGAQKQTINKFERLKHERNELADTRLRSSSVYDALCQVFLTEIVFTAALVYGLFAIPRNESGKLVTLSINLLYMCVTSISIGFHLNGAGIARKNAEEINEVLNESPLIERDPLRTREDESIKPTPGNGSIVFKDVSFCYPSRPEVEVLKGISLTVSEGEHLAIVGQSGAGKSTLTALLLRFYDPSSGTISLDGVNLRDIRPKDLRAECSLVSQEPVLFDGTIGDNIRYGRLNATQAEINEAARKVGAWKFISGLPEGMRTRVGDRGLQLSGGQKQRVAIARAVLRQPKVMIFDEATSALDRKHEGEVQEALEAASIGLTTVTITHRLSTIRNADRVIVLEGGRIVEEGHPDQLLANENGRFTKMCNDQRLDELVTAPSSNPSTPSATTVEPLDPEVERRVWARSSLGAHRRLGQSYSIRSVDKEKLARPVMSRKKSARLDYSKVVHREDEDKLPDDDDIGMSKESTIRSLVKLLVRFKEGHSLLAAALPITAVRSVLYLLICFEIPSILALSHLDSYEFQDQTLMVISLYIGLIILKTIFEAAGRLLIALAGHKFCKFLRLEMFRNIMRQGVGFFDEERNSPGRLTHKVMTDSATLNTVVETKMNLLVPAICTPLFAILFSLFLNWKLTLFCAFQFPAYFFVRLIQIQENSKRQRRMVDEEKKAANLATVVLTNMSTIKAYSLQEYFYEVFKEQFVPLAKAMKRQSIISAFVFASQNSFTCILISLTIRIGESMMSNDEITYSNYIRVVLLTQLGSNFFSQLVSSISDMAKAKVAGEHILEVIEEKTKDIDNLTEEGLRPILKGSIRFENIGFRYPNRPIVPILKNLNIDIKPGENIAIVGPSGSGKSTIFGLLQRMYNPTEGQLIFDRFNIRSINPGYLHRVLTCVEQEPRLFSFTIRENIAFGLMEGEATMERIQEAAKVAHIHDFIVSLPQGYDTEIGEFGAQLSGGQKQRIAIARAIIRKPVILLLDEATAALDSSSEKEVQNALEEAGKHCTCIHIAHRLSTIRDVDRIYVLVDGEVREEGHHHQLLDNKSLYYEMHQLT